MRASWVVNCQSTDFCIALRSRYLLVHANNRNNRIIRSFINFQHILHICDKCRILLWRYYPAFSQVRLEFVFFKTQSTVWSLIVSTSSNSTSLSASIFRVHLARPAGGSLQAIAISCASFSPSILSSRGGLSRFFRSRAASIPC